VTKVTNRDTFIENSNIVEKRFSKKILRN